MRPVIGQPSGIIEQIYGRIFGRMWTQVPSMWHYPQTCVHPFGPVRHNRAQRPSRPHMSARRLRARGLAQWRVVARLGVIVQVDWTHRRCLLVAADGRRGRGVERDHATLAGAYTISTPPPEAL